MPLKPPLSGVRIQLAGAVPDTATSIETAGILKFVETLASALFREGGALVHGSHPSLIPSLKNAAEKYIDSGGSADALTLVRSHQYANTTEQFSEIASQRTFASVHIIPPNPSNPAVSLVSMRDWMTERSDVIVAVGGKWSEINRARAGVPLELEDALKQGKAAFVIGGFGGAIKDHLKDDMSIYSRLRNGLSELDNRSLAESSNIEFIVNQIVQQLKRLPLVRESVSSTRPFRILALDGGGLRGAFTAAVLTKWDEMLKKGGGNSLVNHFDMVAGTSTGAILAIGLGLGLAPKEILSFYRSKGSKIFPKDRKLRHWLTSKHDSQTLREMLNDVFGKKTLSESSCCRLVIPTVRAKHGETEVIVTAHHPDRTAHREILAVDAALASSAAPTYFDEAYVENSVSAQPYLDGGIWANNPILPAISEAVRYLGVPLNRIDVLSVGTLGCEADFTKSLGQGKAGWGPTSADLFFAAQEHSALEIANALLTPARHLRINQQTPSPILLDDTEALEDMVKRGDILGQDSFAAVRSRFLDGFHVPDWRSNSF